MGVKIKSMFASDCKIPTLFIVPGRSKNTTSNSTSDDAKNG